MSIFDIIGPVMIGPSSSHTAGAARIGRVARKLLGEDVEKADIRFHGSFATTGKGHGTDRAIVAGLMGLAVDDLRLPDSLAAAKEAGIKLFFAPIDLGEVHPNTVRISLVGKSGEELEMIASSIGGGMIRICEINGLPTSFDGELPTLVVSLPDRSGIVSEVSSVLGGEHINIAKLQLFRGEERGGKAVMVLECDQPISAESLDTLKHLPDVKKVIYLEPDVQ